MINRAILGLAFSLASCATQNTAPPFFPPKFTVGYPYQSGGEWRYPQVYNNYDVTGLSTVIFNHRTQNADNENYNPDALAAASPVLQLPAIVTVTNLVNGYQMDVMVNDRGPDDPGRILSVTPKVATLLGFPSGGVVEVEVALNEQATAALDATLGQGPKLTAAPVAGIQTQSLAPPGSSQAAGATQNLTPPAQNDPAAAVPTLSGTVTSVPPSPGPLFVQIPGFGRERDAESEAQQLYGIPYQITPIFGGDRTLYAINAGPYHSVEDADAALKTLLGRGVTDPQIIVR